MKPLSEIYKELGIAFRFPIEIRDSNGKATYFEDSDGYWERFEYNAEGRPTYSENIDEFWQKWGRSTNGRLTSLKNSDGVQRVEN